MRPSLTQVTSYGFLVIPAGLYTYRTWKIYRHGELSISAAYTLHKNEVS